MRKRAIPPSPKTFSTCLLSKECQVLAGNAQWARDVLWLGFTMQSRTSASGQEEELVPDLPSCCLQLENGTSVSTDCDPSEKRNQCDEPYELSDFLPRGTFQTLAQVGTLSIAVILLSVAEVQEMETARLSRTVDWKDGSYADKELQESVQRFSGDFGWILCAHIEVRCREPGKKQLRGNISRTMPTVDMGQDDLDFPTNQSEETWLNRPRKCWTLVAGLNRPLQS